MTGPADRASGFVGLLVRGRPGADARAVLGGLVRHARSVDLAVGRIRLAAVDFDAAELQGLVRCRVLLGGFDNHALTGAIDAAVSVPALARNLGVLSAFIASGRLEIRSAGARQWTPDFGLARGPGLEPWFEGGSAVIMGHLSVAADHAHPYMGPAFTAVIRGRGPVDEVRRCFEQLWHDGYPVTTVVGDALAAFHEAGAHGGSIPGQAGG